MSEPHLRTSASLADQNFLTRIGIVRGGVYGFRRSAYGTLRMQPFT